jgi:small subunit ribosomal protein S27e
MFKWELLPKPKSKFLRVRCPKCGNEMIVFSHATTKVQCRICGEVLAKSTGGRAIIRGEVLSELE